MVVLVHSLGSAWLQKAHPDGYMRVWNTTGVRDNRGVRPRSKIFGQIALGRAARAEFNKRETITPSLWLTTALEKRTELRQLQLIAHPPAGSDPERILVTVSNSLVGRLTDTAWDSEQTEIVSFSEWKDRQEVMLLMAPFGWLRGPDGTAALRLDGRMTCNWSVTK